MRDVTDDDLKGFFAGLDQVVGIARRAQARLDLELATGFSPLHYLRPDELAFSRILADLLDAAGSHGQGDRFLRKFAETFDVRDVPPDAARSRVSLEHPTPDGRRIDILLEIGSPVRFALAIENKPWAREQPDQIASYVDYLSEYPDWLMVYMTSDGRRPTTLDPRRCTELTQQGRLCLLAYKESADTEHSLEEWLLHCHDVCRARSVRWFIQDLLRYVRAIFDTQALGAWRMTEQVTREATADLIAAHPRNVDLALAIRDSFPLARNKIIKSFLDKIEEAVMGAFADDWISENTLSTDLHTPPWIGLVLHRPGWRFKSAAKGGVWVGTYHPTDMTSYIGVECWHDEPFYDRDEIWGRVETLFAKPKSDKWCPIWEYLDAPLDNWENRDFLLQLLEPDTCDRLVDSLSNRLIALARAVAPVFDNPSRR